MDLACSQKTFLYLLAMLALTFMACIISSTRERFTYMQNRTKLLSIYKHHAISVELLHYATVLIVLDPPFTTEETSTTTDILLCTCAVGLASLITLIAMNAIDAWSVPKCWDEIFDPMFRLTRDLVYDCRFSVAVHLSVWIEWLTGAEIGILPRSRPPLASPNANARSKKLCSGFSATSSKPKGSSSATACGTAMTLPDGPTRGYLEAQVTQLDSLTTIIPENSKAPLDLTIPPPAPPLPGIRPNISNIRPHYEGQTLSSASRSVKLGTK